ncbi:type II/IV secretion system protein [Neptuniibacter sp.]|uniref:GspE/PulE family protein n=1 Tax=Neptuniibacter sp. TaxID=1962643 RepID=UPI00262F2BCD|nr:type II/IV secretion system protein [Neptuniibacter sp.]MCP4595119.1 Flp pilus assembly complex ATPase component [Neptuniibacter sp.]
MNKEIDKKVFRIGDSLLTEGFVSEEKMAIALQKQQVTGEKLGELLVRLGIVSEYDLGQVLAQQRELEFLDIETIASPAKDVLGLFNQQFCLRRSFLPLKIEDGLLHILIGNCDIEAVLQDIVHQTGLNCVVFQGEFSKVQQSIRHFYFFFDHPVEDLFQREIKKLAKDTDQVIAPDNLIEHLLHLAVKQRATDIHIQPEQKSLHISFRIDGVLRPIFALPNELKRLIVAVKMAANMDISDTLRPQDGSFSADILETSFDVRVSTIVTDFGENMVLRLLPNGMHVKGLSQLGFYQTDLDLINSLFAHPHGILLMTGPTGSGKSTTLHAGLRCPGMESKNILTVEDPIEYKLPIINQTQVNRKAGYKFDSAIRHFLRHDPDVMLVGEIRDNETANAAITAAETGHLVLSTLHVNSVLGVVSRLHALDIPPQMVADTLIGVINQRLARKICNHCKESYEPSPEELEYFQGRDVSVLYRGVGCKHCDGSGFIGRLPVYEIMQVTPALAAQIAAKANRGQLAETLATENFVPIGSVALRRVEEGATTLNEVIRLLGSSLKGG